MHRQETQTLTLSTAQTMPLRVLRTVVAAMRIGSGSRAERSTRQVAGVRRMLPRRSQTEQPSLRIVLMWLEMAATVSCSLRRSNSMARSFRSQVLRCWQCWAFYRSSDAVARPPDLYFKSMWLIQPHALFYSSGRCQGTEPPRWIWARIALESSLNFWGFFLRRSVASSGSPSRL